MSSSTMPLVMVERGFVNGRPTGTVYVDQHGCPASKRDYVYAQITFADDGSTVTVMRPLLDDSSLKPPIELKPGHVSA